MKIIEQNIEQINKLCEQHKVDSLYVFGSVVTDKFTLQSDIDLLIEFGQVEPLEYFNNFMNLKESLEALFKRPVDLLEEKAIVNPFLRKSIDKQKQLIYGRTHRKVAV